MREKIIYIAEDGTSFDDMDDCRSYELECSISKVADGLILLDINYKPLKIYDYGTAIYVIVRDENVIEPLKTICKEWGYCSPWDYNDNEEKCGIYVYNGVVYNGIDDEMYNLEDRLNNLKGMKAKVDLALGDEFGFETLYK